MTDIIIQGICGRMGRALLEKIGVRDDCRVVAGVDREPGHLGEIPIFSDFDALPSSTFPLPPGLWLQHSMAQPTVCPA